jgi:hypothetical protein
VNAHRGVTHYPPPTVVIRSACSQGQSITSLRRPSDSPMNISGLSAKTANSSIASCAIMVRGAWKCRFTVTASSCMAAGGQAVPWRRRKPTIKKRRIWARAACLSRDPGSKYVRSQTVATLSFPHTISPSCPLDPGPPCDTANLPSPIPSSSRQRPLPFQSMRSMRARPATASTTEKGIAGRPV